MPNERGLCTEDSLLAVQQEIVKKGGKQFGNDLYQEVWLKFLRKVPAPQWSPAQIRRIAHNKLIDMQRFEKRRRHSALAEVSATDYRDSNPLVLVVKQDEQERVKAALAKLPADSKELLSAQFERGETDQETAVRIAVPVETLRTRKKRAKQRLIALLHTLPRTM